MNEREFCYWLQGFFELNAVAVITPEQTNVIRNHLNLVFTHAIDPSYSGDPATLQAIHDGKQIGQTMPDGSIARC